MRWDQVIKHYFPLGARQRRSGTFTFNAIYNENVVNFKIFKLGLFEYRLKNMNSQRTLHKGNLKQIVLYLKLYFLNIPLTNSELNYLKVGEPDSPQFRFVDNIEEIFHLNREPQISQGLDLRPIEDTAITEWVPLSRYLSNEDEEIM